MPNQHPLVVDRSTPFGTGVKVSLAGLLGVGGATVGNRYLGTTDEFEKMFIAIAIGGAVFFLIGLSMLLWRSQVVLDRNSGKGLQWNGVLVPMRRSRFRLRDVRHVTFTCDTFSTRHSSHSIYSARLEGPAKAVVLLSDTTGLPVRQAAEDAARYLGVPLNGVSRDKRSR